MLIFLALAVTDFKTLIAQNTGILKSTQDVHSDASVLRLVFLEFSPRDGSIIPSALNKLPWRQSGIVQTQSNTIVELTLKINGLKSPESLKDERTRGAALRKLRTSLGADVLLFVGDKVWANDSASAETFREFSTLPETFEGTAHYTETLTWLGKMLGFNAIITSKVGDALYAKSFVSVKPGQQGVIYSASITQKYLFDPKVESVQAIVEITDSPKKGVFALRVLLPSSSTSSLKTGSKVSLLTP